MNEEITVAIEELRGHSFNKPWFIPILFSECRLATLSIGDGQTIQDIQCIDLHQDWQSGIAQLLEVIQPVSTAIREYVACVQSDDRVEREKAFLGLTEIGTEAVTVLVELLRDEDEEIRRLAENALIQVGRPAVPNLLNALSSGDSDVQVRLCAVLGKIGDPRAGKALMRLLDQPNENHVRPAAIRALASMGGAVFPLLTNALFDGPWCVRASAAIALGMITDDAWSEAVWPLAEKLADDDPRVRQHIAEALHELGDRRAIPALENALQNEQNKIVRFSLASTLRHLQGGNLRDQSNKIRDVMKWSELGRDMRPPYS